MPPRSRLARALTLPGSNCSRDRWAGNSYTHRGKGEWDLLDKGFDDGPLSKAVMLGQQTLVKIRISLTKFSGLVDLGTKVLPIVLIHQSTF